MSSSASRSATEVSDLRPRASVRDVIVSAALGLAAIFCPYSSAAAQTSCRAVTRQLATLGPRARLEALRAAGRADRDVVTDASVCAARADSLRNFSFDIAGHPVRVAAQPTIVRAAFLANVADPRDDGAAWYGRGANYYLRAGASLDAGWLHVVAAPEVWHAQNKPFEVFPSVDASRNSFASPWYAGQFSIDLPSRFGGAPVTQLDPGESAAWISIPDLDVGVATSSQQWGPGLRGTLLIGPNAQGIPRVFARTRRPVHTRIGNFAGEAFAGTLSESRYFDSADTNDLRQMLAWNVAWSPGDSSAFTLGIGHAAQRLGSSFGGGHAQAVRGTANQINELYAQYRDWRAGMRAWAELGRAGSLPTGRQFVTVPYQGLAYLVGAERAVRSRRGTVLISFEAANLEQPTDIRGAPRQDFYTSGNIPQGWTQRGQLLGYSTGPGSNSQWLATDWISERWSFGLFGERVRWNEDAFIRQYLPYPNRHDVTMRGGARGGVVIHGTELAIEASTGHRINYLFQNGKFIPDYRTVDLALPSLRLSITPATGLR